MIEHPSDLSHWQAQRLVIRERLWGLLGDLPDLFVPQATITNATQHDGFSMETIEFDNGAGVTVSGDVLIPDGISNPAPAVLYCHQHGGQYEVGKKALMQAYSGTLSDGLRLVQAGYVVLAIDAYAFNTRLHQGPAGMDEAGRDTEASLFKQFLWQGKTLWGMMVRDDLLALAYLRTRPEVDMSRIGVTGMSLGSSRTTWISALDDDVKVTIPIAQMTRYRDFDESGHYRGHSFYYYVPGALASGLDMEHIISLTAPRPQRILIGDKDPLSPFVGVQKVVEYAQSIYALYGKPDNLEITIYPDVDHVYTATMHDDMIAGFAQHL